MGDANSVNLLTVIKLKNAIAYHRSSIVLVHSAFLDMMQKSGTLMPGQWKIHNALTFSGKLLFKGPHCRLLNYVASLISGKGKYFRWICL